MKQTEAMDRRVLLVDDEQALLFAWSHLLPKSYGLVTASSGERALRLLAEPGCSIELALVDLTMPGLSGPELLRRMRAAVPRLKIVVVSGLPAESAACLLQGVPTDGYLVKPVDRADMIALLDNMLGKRGADCAVPSASMTEVARLPVHALLAHALEGLMVFRADGRCVYLNPAARAMLGLKDAQEAFQPPVYWAERVRQVLEEGRARTYEDVITGPGSLRVAESSWSPWPGEAGVEAGVLAVYRDVTERRQLAAERRQLAQRLLDVQERERKGVSQFLHDHMGPLVIMAKMEVEQLSRSLKPAQRARADQAMARLDEALQGIRHKALALRPPLLDDLAVREALAFLVEQSRERDRLSVVLDPVPPLPGLSPAMKTCLFRVLQEALQRVADQSPQADVQVRVEERGALLAMTICDNGSGGDPAAEVTDRPLGWAGMREIVQSLGGDLSVRAEADRGTRVEVVVPREETGAGGVP